MSWVVTGKTVNKFLVMQPGTETDGGFFGGLISHTADGNPTHALIVAPKATGDGGTRIWASNENAPDGVNYSSTSVGGSFTGSIAGTTMTVTAVFSGKIRPGHTITGTGVALGTTVVSQLTQSNGDAVNLRGTYTVSVPQTVTSGALTAGTSVFDGVTNGTLFKDIDNTVGSGSTIFPAVNFCEALTIGGYSDWYLPSRFELAIAYVNFKPGTTVNNAGSFGFNNYSVPKRLTAYTSGDPAKTTIPPFNTASETFVETFYWTSTEANSGDGTYVLFTDGVEGQGNKSLFFLRQRAFRRIAL